MIELRRVFTILTHTARRAGVRKLRKQPPEFIFRDSHRIGLIRHILSANIYHRVPGVYQWKAHYNVSLPCQKERGNSGFPHFVGGHY